MVCSYINHDGVGFPLRMHPHTHIARTAKKNQTCEQRSHGIRSHNSQCQFVWRCIVPPCRHRQQETYNPAAACNTCTTFAYALVVWLESPLNQTGRFCLSGRCAAMTRALVTCGICTSARYGAKPDGAQDRYFGSILRRRYAGGVAFLSLCTCDLSSNLIATVNCDMF